MTTTADDKLDSAQAAVKLAISCLTEVVILECHGHNEFRPDFTANMHEALLKLIEVKRLLTP